MHNPGDPIRLKADVQNKVEALVLGQAFGAEGVDLPAGGVFGVTVRIINTSGDLMDRWSLCQLGNYSISPNDTDQGRRDPTLEAAAPTWPDIFGRGAIVTAPTPAGKSGRALILGVAPATVNVITAGDGFAAPDYEDPKRLRSADTGEFQIYGSPSVGVQTLLVGVPMVRGAIWHYERTGDYPAPLVKLLTLVNDLPFSGSQTVILGDKRELMADPLQVTGDKGICRQVGPWFFAINAPC